MLDKHIFLAEVTDFLPPAS